MTMRSALRTDLRSILDGALQVLKYFHINAMIEVSDDEAKIAVVSKGFYHPNYFRVVVNESHECLNFYIGTKYEKENGKLVWGEIPDQGYDHEDIYAASYVGNVAFADFLADYEGIDDEPVSWW